LADVDAEFAFQTAVAPDDSERRTVEGFDDAICRLDRHGTEPRGQDELGSVSSIGLFATDQPIGQRIAGIGKDQHVPEALGPADLALRAPLQISPRERRRHQVEHHQSGDDVRSHLASSQTTIMTPSRTRASRIGM
jgi:hypothetical protein